MEKSVKSKAMFAFIWKFLERFGAQLVSFIVSLVLARLITPAEFGTVSIIMILITFCNVFVEAGFGTALIQKKDADTLDFSTITYFSLFSSVVFYLILFFLAPLISKLYEIAELTILIRVMGIRMIFSGYNSVQHAYIAKNLQFKKFFFTTSIGTILSAIVGVVMAYFGYGVWALIAQYLTNVVCDTILLSIVSKLRLKFQFSFKRLKKLLGFSVGILGASLVDVAYDELRGIIIGIKYSPTDLAQYNRASNIPSLFGNNINSTISSVMFPMLTTFQDDKIMLKQTLKKYMKISSFFLMPVYVGLAVLAHDLVLVLYTDKWLQCVPYMQMICVGLLFSSFNTGNLQVFKAMGKSKLVFWLNVIKKVCYTIIILSTMWFGVFWIAFAVIPINVIAVLVNSFPSKKLIDYGFFEQLWDIIPNLIPTLIMGGVVIGLGYINMNIYALLAIQVITGVIVYFGSAFLFKNKSLKMGIEMLKALRVKKKAAAVNVVAQEEVEEENKDNI